MGTPITFTITAETLEAVRNLQAFAEQVQQGFKKTETAAQAAGVKVEEFTVRATRGLQALAENAKRTQKVLMETGNGLSGQSFGGRGVGNWFTANQAGQVSQGLERVARSAGNTRIVYMQLGSSIQAVTSSAILGLSPLRALAVQTPELVQTAAMAGLGLGTIGAALLALTPLLITGGFAMAAYSARLNEAQTAASLLAQTQKQIADNTKFLAEARDKKLIDPKDFDYISQLLRLNSRAGLDAAREEMKRLGIAPEQLSAAEKFRTIMHDARLGGLGTGVEAEQARALDAYQAKLTEIQDLVNKNASLKPQQEAANAAAKAEYDAQLAAIQNQENKRIESEALKKLDTDLTVFRIDNADKVTGKAQQQFDIESSIYGELLRNQIIDQKRYDELWNAANLKRIEGIKNETKEIQQRDATIANGRIQTQLASVQGQARGIESDPLLTRAQKGQQLLALYQRENQLIAENIALQQRRINDPALSAEAQIGAQRELVTLQQQQADLQQQQLTLAGQDSFSFQFGTALVGLQDQWGSWAQQLATNFSDVFNSAIASISSGITNLIMGTKSWGQALQEIGSSILNSIIGAIVQMGVRWITTRILMATVGKTIEASMVAASAPIAAAASAIWAVPATLATIASYGGAAAAAPGLIALAEGITLATAAFADGGRPNVGEVALVGERGPELFVPDSAGTIIPAHETARIMEGGGGGRAGVNLGATAAPQVHVAVLNDRQDLQRFLEESAGENAIVRIVNRRRTDIGLDT